MNATTRKVGCVLVVTAIMLSAWPAPAEVSVSVTFSGPIEELMPILQQIRDLGLAGAQKDSGVLKMQVHSVAAAPGVVTAPGSPTTSATVVTTPPVPPVPPKPMLGMESVTIKPVSAKPGEKCLATVRVTDPDHKVNTISATLRLGAGISVDMRDNGTQGDATANDGVWSGYISLPADAAPGDYPIIIEGFGADGKPVLKPAADGGIAPLKAETKLNVAR